MELQERLDAVPGLRRKLGALEPGVKRRDHVQLASSGDRRAPRQVDRAQLDGRTGQGAHDRGGVGRVGQHSQPGEHVANLRPLKERGVAGEPEGDRALLERRRHEPRFAPSRSDDQADLFRANLPGREQMLDLPRGGLRLGSLPGAAPEANPSAEMLRNTSAASSAPTHILRFASGARNHSADILRFASGVGGLQRWRGGRVTRLHRDFVASASDLPIGQAADRRCCPCHGGPEAEGAVEDDVLGLRMELQEGRRGVSGGDRGSADRLGRVARAHQVSVLGGQPLDQPAMGEPRILELVHHHVPKARGERAPDVGALAGRGGRARSRGRRRPGCRSPAGRGRGWRRSRRTHARGSRARAPRRRMPRAPPARPNPGAGRGSRSRPSSRRSDGAAGPAALPGCHGSRAGAARGRRGGREASRGGRRRARWRRTGRVPPPTQYSRSSRSAAAS